MLATSPFTPSTPPLFSILRVETKRKMEQGKGVLSEKNSNPGLLPMLQKPTQAVTLFSSILLQESPPPKRSLKPLHPPSALVQSHLSLFPCRDGYSTLGSVVSSTFSPSVAELRRLHRRPFLGALGGSVAVDRGLLGKGRTGRCVLWDRL